MKRGLASSAGSDVPRDFAWYAEVRVFDPTVWQHSFMGIGHEVITSAILPLLLFRVGLLSIIGQRMYTKYWFISYIIYNAPVICNHCHCQNWDEILTCLFAKPGYMSSSAGTYTAVRGHFFGQSPVQIMAGNSEISPASLGMKPKTALFHVTAGMMLRSKHGT